MSRFSFMHEGSSAGFFEVSDLPGCPQVAVSHNVFLLPQFRGIGLGHKFMRHRLGTIRDLGYNCVLATVDKYNGAEIATLEKARWENVKLFESSRTDNNINIWLRDIY